MHAYRNTPDGSLLRKFLVATLRRDAGSIHTWLLEKDKYRQHHEDYVKESMFDYFRSRAGAPTLDFTVTTKIGFHALSIQEFRVNLSPAKPANGQTRAYVGRIPKEVIPLELETMMKSLGELEEFAFIQNKV